MDLSWQTAHNILPTNQRLHRFNIISSPNCACCSSVETVEHLFVHCWVAQAVWQQTIALLNTFTSNPQHIKLDYRVVLFNIIPPPVTPRINEVIITIVNQGKYIIWKARNLIKFERKVFSPSQVSSFLISILKNKLNIDKLILSETVFRCLWLEHPSGIRLGSGGEVLFDGFL